MTPLVSSSKTLTFNSYVSQATPPIDSRPSRSRLRLARTHKVKGEDIVRPSCQYCSCQFEGMSSLSRSTAPHLPIQLSCYHSFCQDCVASMFSQGGVVCPDCSQSTIVDSLDSLPIDFVAIKLIRISGITTSPEGRICGLCEDTDGQIQTFCDDCNEPLCDGCVIIHEKIKTYRGHHSRKLGADASGIMKDICTKCIIPQHPGHRPAREEPTHDAARSQELCTSVIGELRSTQIAELDTVKEQVNNAMEQLECNREESVGTVNAYFDKLLEQIQSRKLSCLEAVQQITDSKRKALEKQVNDLSCMANGLHGICDFAENLVQFGSSCEFQSLEPSLIKHLEAAKHLKINRELAASPGIQVLNPNYDNILGTIRRFLLITGDTVVPAATFIPATFQAQLEQVRQDVPLIFIVQAVGRDGKVQTRGGDDLQISLTLLEASSHECVGEVTDLENGRYLCRLTPVECGPAQLSVKICGHQIDSSPFQVTVNSPFHLPSFQYFSDGLLCEESGRHLSVDGPKGYHEATVGAPVPTVGSTYWQIRVSAFTRRSWLAFGLIGNQKAGHESFCDTTFFGWNSSGEAYSQGVKSKGSQIRDQIIEEDLVYFRYDSQKQILSCALGRIDESVYHVPIGPDIPRNLFIHVNLSEPGDKIELLPCAADSLSTQLLSVFEGAELR